jgi:hypothetical protein
MSDYVKPVKQCSDAPVGIQTVNELAESQDAQRALLRLEHVDPPDVFSLEGLSGFVGGGKLQPSEGPAFGEHNTPKVARGVIGLDVDPNLAAFGAPIVTLRYQSGVCDGYVRTAVGMYFFPIVGLSELYGEAMPIDTFNDGAVRVCQVFPVSSATINTASVSIASAGLYVSTWEETTLDSSNLGFELASFSFDLVVYGNYDTELTPQLISPVLSARVDRHRRWHPRSRIVQPF